MKENSRKLTLENQLQETELHDPGNLLQETQPQEIQVQETQLLETDFRGPTQGNKL